MKRLAQTAAIGLTIALTTAAAFADTLILKNGERVSGYFEGGSARVLKFRAADGVVRDYDIISVELLQFGDEPKPAVAAAPPVAAPMPAPVPALPARVAATPAPIVAPTAPATPTPTAAPAAPATPTPTVAPAATITPAAGPRLLGGAERPPDPNTAKTSTPKFTLPIGATITIRMVDSISSERQKAGDSFLAVLDEAIVQGGVELVAKGVDVRGRIASANEAGRIAGAAELRLELTQILIGGANYALNTSEYSEIADNRGAQTARRTVGGAGVGAIIGAIAGGGRGAALGAGIGGGAGVASTALTKGEKLSIPPETRLQFTLRAPLVVGE